jgi:hemerythrin-like domain-containing protein
MSGYVDLLRAHIQKENMILFPMAERLLEPESQTQIEAAFQEAEKTDKKARGWREWAASELRGQA